MKIIFFFKKMNVFIEILFFYNEKVLSVNRWVVEVVTDSPGKVFVFNYKYFYSFSFFFLILMLFIVLVHLDRDHLGKNAREIVVPTHYKTPTNAKYKGKQIFFSTSIASFFSLAPLSHCICVARALHYALEASLAAPTDWIVHLDEETRFNEQTILEIEKFAAREAFLAARGVQRYPAIGQGKIGKNESEH